MHQGNCFIEECSDRLKEKTVLLCLLIFIIALTVRVNCLNHFAAFPLYRHYLADDGWYISKARGILENGIDRDHVFIRSPVYPLMLAGIFKITGGSVFAARLVNLALDCSTALALSPRAW